MKSTKTDKRPQGKASRSAVGNETATTPAAVIEERIRERAYHCWEEAGCPAGDGVEFWLKAEAELVDAKTATDRVCEA